MNMRNAFCALAIALLATNVVRAAVVSVQAVQVDNTSGGASLDGYNTFDILIDFDGDPLGLGFQQMVLELTHGLIYQHNFGGDTPPSAALIPTFPDLAFDTFVSMGGAVAADSEEVWEVGDLLDIPGRPPRKFDMEGINITWYPAPGVFLRDPLTDFMTARITLSDDARGTFSYIGVGNSDPQEEWWRGEADICFGSLLCGEVPLIPVDTDLGDRPHGTIIEHTFTVSSSAGDVEWSNLVVNGPGQPAIAPTLGADGEFSWNSANSPLGLYTFDATVADQFGDDVAHLTVNLVIPEPASATLFALALGLALASLRTKC